MHPRLRLFLLSVFILYLELLLVRWIGTEVSIFAYLQNAVLICCFLGLGLGCIAKPTAFTLGRTFSYLALLALFLSFEVLRQHMTVIGDMLSVLHDFVVWRSSVTDSTFQLVASVTLGMAGTFVIASFIWRLMVPLGAELGSLLDADPSPVSGYSVNILGSLVGAWLS